MYPREEKQYRYWEERPTKNKFSNFLKGLFTWKNAKKIVYASGIFLLMIAILKLAADIYIKYGIVASLVSCALMYSALYFSYEEGYKSKVQASTKSN
ncbi:MAG: hypothetical protein A3C50_02955 [Candidatus Staskawiczbacteria bacterium RIFCSPHIGHO2_02_FULL_43_16]|uniref:Uncharacterized protein n=1 Tax=Candidatus Staskawiczbacteria bacterium RIFCSPHIGHO2_01_FULL_41_41 TaxID=1802203 RepID=A0A1G2HRM1_9BACT|nr:MAG: hypothetical protein A2822_01140 [Candidatus Staskawiczbacteria bacterium RIFCSPHIGHO2_01_FULL_41_41]OGZ68574.1 MAG: hypothetical protein A3C50_02955 [Candidatus Staskawiczbacteria bacterium RIFCSPHIGHO2_02_FULL_43_16]